MLDTAGWPLHFFEPQGRLDKSSTKKKKNDKDNTEQKIVLSPLKPGFNGGPHCWTIRYVFAGRNSPPKGRHSPHLIREDGKHFCGGFKKSSDLRCSDDCKDYDRLFRVNFLESESEIYELSFETDGNWLRLINCLTKMMIRTCFQSLGLSWWS